MRAMPSPTWSTVPTSARSVSTSYRSIRSLRIDVISSGRSFTRASFRSEGWLEAGATELRSLLCEPDAVGELCSGTTGGIPRAPDHPLTLLDDVGATRREQDGCAQELVCDLFVVQARSPKVAVDLIELRMAAGRRS